MSSIAVSTSVSRESRAVKWGRVALVGLATVVAAVIANVLVYYIGDALVAYDPQFEILATVAPVLSLTLEAAVVAVLVYAALLRFSRNPVRVYNIVSVVVFVVTLIPDLTYVPTLPGVSAAQTAILVLTHVVAALVIVPMLTTFAHPQAVAGSRRERSATSAAS